MKKLSIIYNGWGEYWVQGTLADVKSAVVFEYSTAAVERGLELSPLHHPLPRTGAVTKSFLGDSAFHGLPGFVADALPDGWGMLLMDRALRQAGSNPASVSVLERLAIVGNSAMGALSFAPSQEDVLPAEELSLSSLMREVRSIQSLQTKEVDANAALVHLMRLGGSPQGARPKVLADFNPLTGKLASGMAQKGASRPWLVKFPAEVEHREVCAIEEAYAKLARLGGMDMPRSKLFDISSNASAFGVERFDRVVKDAVQQRIPMLSLGGLLQADHRLPSLDYETLLLATLRITGDQGEVLKAFERCIFNVLLHNRDDHARNFAFCLNAKGFWKLSPAFDLTYSQGPGGEHSTSVAGHGKKISRAHLLQIAKTGGIKTKDAERCIDHWLVVVRKFAFAAKDLPIRRVTMALVKQHIAQQSTLLTTQLL